MIINNSIIAYVCIVISIIATLYAVIQGYRWRHRNEQLCEAKLLLQRHSLSREEQMTSMQKLSTGFAQLTEQARVSAIVGERQRLARELHDAVSQQLFAISMTATAVRRTLDKDFNRAQRQVELIEEMASAAQSEMRALLFHLRPVQLEGKGLTQGIAGLIRELPRKMPLEIWSEMDERIKLGAEIENHLFRIVQEALSNTLRHSKATRVEIKLQSYEYFTRLLIQDNGVGFHWHDKKQGSYGLRMMQERVDEIDGTIKFITAPGEGTCIEIRVPIVKQESNLRAEKGNSDGDGSIYDGDDH